MFYGDDEDNDNQRFKFEVRGTNELIIIGINPSTARGKSKHYTDWIDDSTVDRAIAFAANNWNYDKAKIKFDGFMMLNVYAQSSSSTDGLSNVYDSDLHKKNLEKISGYLQGKQNISVLLAYGNPIDKKPYLKECLRNIIDIFRKHGARFFRLGDLTNGNPRHINPRTKAHLPITTPLIEIQDNGELDRLLS